MTSTYHTYPNLVYDKGRLTEIIWYGNCSFGKAIAATLTIDLEAVVLVAKYDENRVVGLRPGGLA